jgi:hypothetical protein
MTAGQRADGQRIDAIPRDGSVWQPSELESVAVGAGALRIT